MQTQNYKINKRTSRNSTLLKNTDNNHYHKNRYCSRNCLSKYKDKLRKLLSRTEFEKKLLFINDKEKASTEIDHYHNELNKSEILVPVISISNKTGHNIGNLHKLVSKLKPRIQWNKEEIEGSLFFIDSDFHVPGIGLVLSGTLKGDIKVNQKLWI